MAVFKCKMCGGNLVVDSQTVATCEYCGTQQTLPKLSDDKCANLYDRANHLRRNNEFDKAMAIYENILTEDGTDAEAYWSLVLCRYGIEYVEDPVSRKRVPTVNRTQFTSIYDDDNYKSALQYADSMQRVVYEQEANVINEIQKGILAISGKEEPFDVFICYKETDANGRRTPDSVLATELYQELTREGFKVFFSRITLETKLGQEYEPYIFAALNSAKVMVALGTKPEYFNAPWVKNEWSRFLALTKAGQRKLLIPAYRDMDAYDLPAEFSHLQALDMAKLGFMQDLVYGIKKIINITSEKPKVKETVITTEQASSNITALLKRGYMALEDGEWTKADDFFEQCLNQNAELAEAYVGKLMSELKAKNKADLGNQSVLFDTNSNYLKAMRFGNDALIKELQGYIEDINRHAKENNYNNIYTEALEDMHSGDIPAVRYALKRLNKIQGWKDVDQKIIECESIIKELDSELAEEDEIRAKKIRKFALISLPIFAAFIVFIIVLKNTVIIPNNKYNDAIRLINDGEYQEALAAFQELGDYKDSKEKINSIQLEIQSETLSNKYNDAVALMEAGEYQKAKTAFEELGDYKDSINKFSECKYNNALALLEEGEYQNALSTFKELGDYKDSKEKIAEMQPQLLKSAEVGDTVYFGNYEQDYDESNGKEAIEWRVLDKEDEKLLVISEYTLDCQLYNEEYVNVTWETCTLRKWLNSDFMNTAFSKKEVAKIPVVTVEAKDNPEYGTDAGNDTKDSVFLLSISEVNKYFDSLALGIPTAYAEARGARSMTCSWWLRSPGSDQDVAAYVHYGGKVEESGISVYHDRNAVRPAMWIDISE